MYIVDLQVGEKMAVENISKLSCQNIIINVKNVVMPRQIFSDFLIRILVDAHRQFPILSECDNPILGTNLLNS